MFGKQRGSKKSSTLKEDSFPEAYANEDASKNSNSSKKSKKSRGQDKRAASKSEAFTDKSEDEAPKPKTPRRLDKRAANKSETSPEESEDEAPKSKSSHGQDKKGRNKSEDSAKESGDDAAEEYEVEKIVDNRINKGKVQYKVHWEGYNTEDDTWENESQLDCQELLEEYLANKQSTEVSNLRNEDASKNSNSSKKSKKSRGQDKRAASKSEAFTDESEDEAPKPKTPRRLDKRAANKSETSPEESEDEAPKSKSPHGQDKKGRNKSEDSAKESGDDAAEEYEVEKIVDNRINKGKVQYKVHWEGYNTEDDTWENESQLDCQELLEEYLANEQSTEVSNLRNEDASKNSNSSKKSKKSRGQDKRAASKSEAFTDESEDEAPKPKTPRRLNKRAANKSDTSPEESEDEAPKSKSPHGQDKKGRNKSEDSAKESGDDAAEEYEVENILEMHTLKNGNREFLVKWVGYSKSDSTWEPERNLTGTDLLEEFLQKVDKAKELDSKELRINRRPTDRFTSTPQGNLRHQSRGYANKQRVKCYDAE